MQVVELFDSISGEGPNSGTPAVFLRLAGCNLRCAYCDTVYAQEPINKSLTVSDVLEKLILKANGDRDLIITGGEPLIQKEEVIKLLQQERLFKHYRHVYIETNGTINLYWIPKLRWGNKISFVVDWKMPSAKNSIKFKTELLTFLRPQDTIKFVGDYGDIKDRISLGNALSYIIDNVKEGRKFRLYFSPIYGTDLQRLADFIQTSKFVSILMKRHFTAKIQLQIHKYIWDPNARGV